jgi:hypothetical protein
MIGQVYAKGQPFCNDSDEPEGNVRNSRDIGKFLKVSHESDLSYLPEYLPITLR